MERTQHGIGYNQTMLGFTFYHPIEVRYGDLDPQGHVNNAKFLTYMEQGRLAYIQHLGLWQGGSFLDLGLIIADIHISFKTPIRLEHAVQIGVRVSQLGYKSFQMEYRLENVGTDTLFATGETVAVTYDYHTSQTIPIPEAWRQKISAFDRPAEKINHSQ